MNYIWYDQNDNNIYLCILNNFQVLWAMALSGQLFSNESINNEEFIVSDADEELLILIPFEQKLI